MIGRQDKKEISSKKWLWATGYTPLGIETAKKFKIPTERSFGIMEDQHGIKYKNNMPSNLIINEVKTINQELINC